MLDVDISEHDGNTHVLVCPCRGEFFMVGKIAEGNILRLVMLGLEYLLILVCSSVRHSLNL